MTNNARYTDKQIIKKYKRSILADQLMSFIPFAALIFTRDIINQFSNVIFLVWILITGFYFTSDYFLNNSSIGKKIYHIEIMMDHQTKKLPLYSVITRRFMELTYHPLFKSDFISLSKKIDNSTGTCIVEKKHKDTMKKQNKS